MCNNEYECIGYVGVGVGRRNAVLGRVVGEVSDMCRYQVGWARGIMASAHVKSGPGDQQRKKFGVGDVRAGTTG